MLFFTALSFAFTTRYNHNWVSFRLGSASSFFLVLFLHSSPVAFWAPGGSAEVNLLDPNSNLVLWRNNLRLGASLVAQLVNPPAMRETWV